MPIPARLACRTFPVATCSWLKASAAKASGGKSEKEGKCGEGKCGGKSEKEGKCGEGKCGGKSE
jgi:uncharacterized low-complexity protein